MHKPIPHTYDSIFEKYRDFIPLAFLRALAYSESNLNPASDMRRDHPEAKSGAVGLFQVMGTVLADWNARNPKETYTRDQLTDPDINSKIGIDLVKRIVRSYQHNHPRSLDPDWTGRYAALLAAGFNAGYSEAAGVGYVVGQMEEAGIDKDRVTADNMEKAAEGLSKASRFLKMADRLKYWKTVASRYEADRWGGSTTTPSKISSVEKPESTGMSIVGALLVLLPIGYLLSSWKGSKR